jgi:hypothetical protein
MTDYKIPLYTKDGCDVKCYWCNGRFPEIALAGVEGEYIHCDCAEEEDFATEWDKDLTTDERVALLAKTFDNKADSDDEEDCSEDNRCGDCPQCAKIKPCSCGCGYIGGSCEKGLAIDNKADSDDEEEEEEEEENQCYGKHCSNTNCLKLVVGWNRSFGVDGQRFAMNLYCDECIKTSCFEKCNACSVEYPLTSLNYRTGGLFSGEHWTPACENLYCGTCCDDIEKKMTL